MFFFSVRLPSKCSKLIGKVDICWDFFSSHLRLFLKHNSWYLIFFRVTYFYSFFSYAWWISTSSHCLIILLLCTDCLFNVDLMKISLLHSILLLDQDSLKRYKTWQIATVSEWNIFCGLNSNYSLFWVKLSCSLLFLLILTNWEWQANFEPSFLFIK